MSDDVDDTMDGVEVSISEKKPAGSDCIHRRISSTYSDTTTINPCVSIDSIAEGFSYISDDYYIYPTVLGTGSFGIVRECTHRATGQTLAAKSIDKSKIERLDYIRREIDILRAIDHPSIMKLIDTFEDSDYVHIITEKYTGGELLKKILDNTTDYGCLPEHKAAKIIKSLLEAVAYLHDNGIVHRDIKPENILFEDEQEDDIKLIDFGLSRRHEKGDALMNGYVGTAYYVSPEMLHTGQYDKSSDLWSVGTVAFMLVCGYPRSPAIVEAIKNGLFELPYQQFSSRSDEAKQFIKSLLFRDPTKRLTAKKALRHPWIIINTSTKKIQSSRRKIQPAVRYLRIP